MAAVGNRVERAIVACQIIENEFSLKQGQGLLTKERVEGFAVKIAHLKVQHSGNKQVTSLIDKITRRIGNELDELDDPDKYIPINSNGQQVFKGGIKKLFLQTIQTEQARVAPDPLMPQPRSKEDKETRKQFFVIQAAFYNVLRSKQVSEEQIRNIASQMNLLKAQHPNDDFADTMYAYVQMIIHNGLEKHGVEFQAAFSTALNTGFSAEPAAAPADLAQG